MKKWMLSILTVVLLISGSPAYAQPDDFDYEKWGRIAVEVAKENDDAEAEISEYKYIGREEISKTEAKDRFQLFVKKDDE